MNIQTRTSHHPVQDGRVDTSFQSSFPKQDLLNDIRDPRIADVVALTGTHDASSFGPEWEGAYSDLPIWGSRGMAGLKRWSTFRAPGQRLEVNWHSSTVTLDTQPPGGTYGHRIEARFGKDRAIIPETVRESVFDRKV